MRATVECEQKRDGESEFFFVCHRELLFSSLSPAAPFLADEAAPSFPLSLLLVPAFCLCSPCSQSHVVLTANFAPGERYRE